MSDVETYDCTSGNASYYMGCYTMTLSVGMHGKPDHFGDWVQTTAHDAAIAAKDAEIERLRELVRRAVEDGWKNVDAAAYLAKHKEGT